MCALTYLAAVLMRLSLMTTVASLSSCRGAIAATSPVPSDWP